MNEKTTLKILLLAILFAQVVNTCYGLSWDLLDSKSINITAQVYNSTLNVKSSFECMQKNLRIEENNQINQLQLMINDFYVNNKSVNEDKNQLAFMKRLSNCRNIGYNKIKNPHSRAIEKIKNCYDEKLNNIMRELNHITKEKDSFLERIIGFQNICQHYNSLACYDDNLSIAAKDSMNFEKQANTFANKINSAPEFVRNCTKTYENDFKSIHELTMADIENCSTRS